MADDIERGKPVTPSDYSPGGARKSLVDLMGAKSLSRDEQVLLRMKLTRLDQYASMPIPDAQGIPIRGSRWYGDYNLYVDWNADGDYNDSNEDLSARFLAADIRRGIPGPFAFVATPASIEVTVENGDRMFSTDNEDSPIYTELSDGVKKGCYMTLTTGGSTYTLFTGFLKEVASQPTTHGKRVATLVVDDMMGRLAAVPMISALEQDSNETASLMTALAPVVTSNYGSAYYGHAYYDGDTDTPTITLGTALSTFPFVGDIWRESTTASLDAVGDIMRSVLGRFFCSKAGALVYRNRQWRPLNGGSADWDASLVSRVEAVGAQDETLINEMLIILRTRVEQDPAQVVWSMSETVTIGPNTFNTYTATFSDPTTGVSCGVIDGIPPQMGTDVLPFNPQVEVTANWRGADATLKVTNTSASPVDVTFLQLRGTPITALDELLFTDGSGDSFRKTRWHSTPILQNVTEAQNYVEWLYSSYSDLTDKPRQALIVPIDPATLAQVAQLDVDSRINVRSGEVSFVNWVHHRIGKGYHIVNVGLSPASDTSMWVLGTSQLGTGTVLGV